MDLFEKPGVDERERQLAAHLQRAGDLLRSEDLVGAEREVGAALQLGGSDLRARNLLGLLRFRAGRNEEAHQIYRELVMHNPEDLSLRLNLGLVELRLGHHVEAADHLRRVIDKEPQNAKAQGYYGMALMRAGDLARARDAFVAAGQDDLVRQVSEKLAGGKGAAAAPVAAASAPASATPAAATASAGPSAAPSLERLALDHLGRTSDPPAPREHASGPLPQPLAAFVAARRLDPSPPGQPFAITEGGALLVVRVEGRLPTRTTGAIVSSGRLAYSPIMRRVRGRDSGESFGEGTDAMCIASGTGLMVVSPRGAKFSAMALEKDVLYVRESAVFAFEETLHFENGRIPGAGPAGIAVVALRGDGRVVVRSRHVPHTLVVPTGEVFYADQDALLGWTGQVVPQQMRGVDGEPTQFIACSGEGLLLLEELAVVAGTT